MNNTFIVYCERDGRKQQYNLTFPYNDQLINRIRELPKDDRKWNGIKKTWQVKTSGLWSLIKSYKGSKKIHFDFGNEDDRNVFKKQIKKIIDEKKEKKRKLNELEENKKKWIEWKKEIEDNYLKYWDDLHINLKKGVSLYPHQVAGAMFLNKTKNALISHEMGLGKTAISIAYVEMNKLKKVIVITPNSLKFNYYGEVEKFTNSKAHIIKWKNNKYSIDESKYIIVNYEYFNPSNNKKFMDKWNDLEIGPIDAVICDESHRLKNSKSNTYKNFSKLFKKKIFRDENESKVFLSGTPAPNRAFELYTIMNQISPLDFSTKKYFYEYYCGMVYTFDYGWVTNITQTNFEELYQKISPYTHRKRKEEVLTNLPDKIYQKIMLEMSQKDLATYNEIEEDVVNDYVISSNDNPLTTMIRLRQFTATLKVKPLTELIENILNTDDKVVIIDYFKDSLYVLKEKFGDVAGLHTGDQSPEERSEIVKQFQDPSSELKIFLGSIQTCNYGLTLTAANKMFIITLPYSVGEYDQVSDRIHRIGQKDVVNIYPLIYPDTIDEIVFSTIEDKRGEIVKVIDNEDYESNIHESIMNEVMNKIQKKYG